MTDEIWERALTCACEVFESHVRQGGISTKDARRAALDDAMQHAFGIIQLNRDEAAAAIRKGE